MNDRTTNTPPGVQTILRLRDVSRMTGLSRSTIYAAMAAGHFPRQIRLTERCVGWSDSEISDWLNERIQGRQ
ncbi:AlpA family phage regulatory protein [Paraburkholderia fungorum]|uniref:helix-turn-helix transcriptional regulator n=1 Tax=Paraburkholderia fungorum TaxID=134537 RepID=UPI0038BCA042